MFVDSLIKTLVANNDSIYNQYFKFKKLTVPSPTETFTQIQYVQFVLEKFHSNQTHVVDHDHFTGKFRGYVHQSCNLNYKDPTFIPIFFHNLSGYDTHLFISEIVNHPAFIPDSLTAISITEEKLYIIFSRFLSWYIFPQEI